MERMRPHSGTASGLTQEGRRKLSWSTTLFHRQGEVQSTFAQFHKSHCHCKHTGGARWRTRAQSRAQQSFASMTLPTRGQHRGHIQCLPRIQNQARSLCTIGLPDGGKKQPLWANSTPGNPQPTSRSLSIHCTQVGESSWQQEHPSSIEPHEARHRWNISVRRCPMSGNRRPRWNLRTPIDGSSQRLAELRHAHRSLSTDSKRTQSSGRLQHTEGTKGQLRRSVAEGGSTGSLKGNPTLNCLAVRLHKCQCMYLRCHGCSRTATPHYLSH
mmetsp:Transcript_13325/g.39959  ORF Transcript_13325/g.39959 Transcript_13325/m.39959 type:complete len:270 (-) Transcript_13325:1982-2791(-)